MRKASHLTTLFSLLAFGSLFSGCGSEGSYTSYIDGSNFTSGRTHDASVSLSLVSEDNTGPTKTKWEPYYETNFTFTSGPRRKLSISFIRDGDFKAISGNEAELMLEKKKHKFTAESDDVLLQEMIEYITLRVIEHPVKITRSVRQREFVVETYHFKYSVVAGFYDEDGRALGVFKETYSDKVERFPEFDPIPPGPRNPSMVALKNFYGFLRAKAAIQ